MIEIVSRGAEKAGGLGKLANALGIRHQSFYSWKKVPAERVTEFSRATGIPRHEVRPDLFVPDFSEISTPPASADTTMEAAE